MLEIQGYDDWKTRVPEAEPVTICDSCGCELYEGDYLYTVNGDKLCEDCLNEEYRRVL